MPSALEVARDDRRLRYALVLIESNVDSCRPVPSDGTGNIFSLTIIAVIAKFTLTENLSHLLRHYNFLFLKGTKRSQFELEEYRLDCTATNSELVRRH